MKIEAGKSYRTRGGYKATIYRTDARGPYSVHGFIALTEIDEPETWTFDGLWSGDEEDGFDLIAPWTDEPTMDISALPAWATHVEYNGPYLEWCWRQAGTQRGGSIPCKNSPSESVPAGSRYRIDRENNRLVLEEGGAK